MDESVSERPLPPSTRSIYAAFDFFGQHNKRILAGILAVGIVCVLASGFYIVKKEEQGVLTRFGKVIDAEVGPGVHYRIPIIERIHIRKVKRIKGYEISSTDGDTAGFFLLTGEADLIEVDLAIQYRIDNLRSFLFASSDPHAVVTMLVREELVDIIGRNFIDLILSSNREVIQRNLFDEVSGQLDSLGVGVGLVALNVVDVRPIEETAAAFRDVNDAVAERMQATSEAHRKREHLIARTKGQAESQLFYAKGVARERVVNARSSAAVFKALLAEYKKDPMQVAITRYWQRMRSIFAEASLSAVNPGDESTIDINMIDGVGGFIPAGIPLEPSIPSDVAGKPLPSSTAIPSVHTVESVGVDKPLLEGQFHKLRAECDHVRGANPRSLIFDAPSIFFHDHVERGGGVIEQQENQKPMVDVITGENASSDDQDSEEDHERSGD